jgi:hypothetical protein
MQRIAIAAAAAILAFCAPGIASATVVGTVYAGWERSDYDYDNFYYGEDHEQGPFLGASVVAPLTNENDNWIVVGEGRIQSEKETYSGGYDEHSNVAHGAIHIGHRTDRWTVAGFYGIENDHGNDVQEIGAEVQYYLPNMTLEGTAAYGDHDGGTGCCDYDGWNAQGNLTYYFNNVWSAGASLGYASWDYIGGSTDITTATVKVEYWVPSTNYSIRGAYTHGEADDTYGDYSSDTFQVAFVVNMGASDAQERDHSGVGLSGADSFDLHWRLWEEVYYID